jgi:predicted nucleotidyltransferase
MSQPAKRNPEHAVRTRPAPVPMIPILQIVRDHLPRLKEEYSIRSLGLFGSYVRGEQKKNSDVDILVEFYETPGLFTFIRLEQELSRIIGHKVDLVMKDSLKPSIGKRVIMEVVPV